MKVMQNTNAIFNRYFTTPVLKTVKNLSVLFAVQTKILPAPVISIDSW